MKESIKAITLHRPWGNAIADYGKNIENRSWKCPLPLGSFLAIHNGKKWDTDGLRFIQELTGIYDAELNPVEVPDGCIIAVARFNGNAEDLDHGLYPWFFGPIGWMLADVVKIDPVPCKGQQGLWNLPDDVLQQVRVNYRASREVA
jgi:hypothetical protein